MSTKRDMNRKQRARRTVVMAAVGILVNVAIIMMLSHFSRVALNSYSPSQRVTALNLVQPPEEERILDRTETPAEEKTTQPKLKLPELELPALDSSMTGLALPQLSPTDDLWDLPAVAPAGLLKDLRSGTGGSAYSDQTTPAQLLTAIDLGRFYPRRAKRQGIEGNTLMRLHIDAAGKVTNAEVISSTPKGVFDDAAKDVCEDLNFLPAKRAGVAIASTLEYELVWKIKN